MSRLSVTLAGPAVLILMSVTTPAGLTAAGPVPGANQGAPRSQASLSPGLSFMGFVAHEDRLEFPNDVAADSQRDRFFTLNNGTGNVISYQLEKTREGWDSGSFLPPFGTEHLNAPPSLAYSPVNSRLYVTSLDNEVAIFSAETGTFIDKFGEPGSGNGQFDFPAGIAVDQFGSVYVVDTRNKRVQRFSADGGYVGQFGSPGSGDGQFTVPLGIAIDLEGNVYVSDEALHRIQKFSSSGQFLTSWGSFGTEAGQLAYPDELAIDDDGNVLVAESGGPRVQKFSPTGESLGFFTGTGKEGSTFNSPHGVEADGKGRVYVASTGESKVYLYDDLRPKVEIRFRRTVSERRLRPVYLIHYNQSFESCDGSASGRITLNAFDESFSIDRGNIPLKRGEFEEEFEINVSKKNSKALGEALEEGSADVDVTFKFTCTDGEKHTLRRSDTMRKR